MTARKKKSKRQSDSNFTEEKPHESLVLFLDRAIGKRVVANALTNVNPMIKVELLDDHFAANAPDEDWLKFVGRKGWIAITKDKRIRYRTPALEVKLPHHRWGLL